MSGKKVKQIDYCQFLLVSQINYTQTYFGDHSEEWSHDQINRYLRDEQITPRQVWENVPVILFFQKMDTSYLMIR
jgi:hypothetical protein